MRDSYYYHGQYCSLAKLASLSGCSVTTIKRRLQSGWPTDLAVETPLGREQMAIAPEWEGKILEVVFHEPLVSVFQSMQPMLHRRYVAYPSHVAKPYSKARPYYLITLENGKPLIVYPGEFEILAEAKERNPYAV